MWFTELRLEQSPLGSHLRKAVAHRVLRRELTLKRSPFTDRTRAKVWGYARANRLDYLPLGDQGFASIACETRTALADDPDSPPLEGRGGNKLQLGTHSFSERVQ